MELNPCLRKSSPLSSLRQPPFRCLAPSPSELARREQAFSDAQGARGCSKRTGERVTGPPTSLVQRVHSSYASERGGRRTNWRWLVAARPYRSQLKGARGPLGGGRMGLPGVPVAVARGSSRYAYRQLWRESPTRWTVGSYPLWGYGSGTPLP